MVRCRVDGKWMNLTPLGWRALTQDDATSSQDSTGAANWEWVWKYKIERSQYLWFSSRRDRRASTTWTMYDAPTTALDDSAKLRLVLYHPDGVTMKVILLDETYGTLKNASRDDIQKLIGVTVKKFAKPGDVLQLETYTTDTLDISECKFQIGYKLFTG